jgi:hypothetical protein
MTAASFCIGELQAYAMDPDMPEIPADTSSPDLSSSDTTPAPIDLDLPSPPCPETDEDAELCLYRKRTVSILKRYFNLSMETGRLPSVLGEFAFSGTS